MYWCASLLLLSVILLIISIHKKFKCRKICASCVPSSCRGQSVFRSCGVIVKAVFLVIVNRRIEKFVKNFSKLRTTVRCKLFVCGVILCYIAGNEMWNMLIAEVPGWERTIDRNISHFVRPNERTVLIDPIHVCSSGPPILLLIVVCSAANNFEKRQAIRQTWGNTTEFNYSQFHKIHKRFHGLYLDINYKMWNEKLNIDAYPLNDVNNTKPIDNTDFSQSRFNVKLVFLLGQTIYNQTQNRINDESEHYNDVIQENFLDTYNNLTLKAVMMLKWVTNNCAKKVQYLMKCDDDMFVNIPNLIHVLLGGTVPIYKATLKAYDTFSVMFGHEANRLMMTKELLIGARFCLSHPIRYYRNKWYVPNYMFDGGTYPVYLSGCGYLMTIDVALKLYEATFSIPLIHMEDVYLTGICAKAVNITPIDHQLIDLRALSNICELRGMITKHQFNANQLREAYAFVTNSSAYCPPPEDYTVRDAETCRH